MPTTEKKEFTTDKITVEWISKCDQQEQLKKALSLLQQNGDKSSLPLKQAINEKLAKLESSHNKLELQKGVTSERSTSNREDESYQSQEERDQLAEKEKVKGNDAFKAKDWKQALDHYTNSIFYNPKVASTLSNRALVHLKLNDFKSALKDASKALEIDPNYTKALHRKGRAHSELGEIQEAVSDFQRILELEPNNQEVQTDLNNALLCLKNKAPEKALNTSSSERNKKLDDAKKGSNILQDALNDKDANFSTDSPLDSTFSRGSIFQGLLPRDEEILWIQVSKELDALRDQGLSDMKEGLQGKAVETFEKSLHILNNYTLSSTRLDNKIHKILGRKTFCLVRIAECYMSLDAPDSAVKYLSFALQIKDLEDQMQGEILLQRALAYEKLDKLRLAKNDFQRVLELNRTNQDAVEGIKRIDEILIEIDPELAKQKELEGYDILKDDKAKLNLFEALEKQKNEANLLFKTGDLKKAKEAFQFIILKIEKAFKDLTNDQAYKDKYSQLYIQVLFNRALTCYNRKEFDECLIDCKKGLKIDPKHEKCLYRKALCIIAEAQALNTSNQGDKNSEVLQKQIELYEIVMRDLDEMSKINSKNQEAKDKRSEVVELIQQLKKKLTTLESKENVSQPASTSEIKSNNLSKSEALTDKGNFIEVDDVPSTSGIFESICQSYKKDHSNLFAYIKKIPLVHLKKLYQKTDFKSELLMSITKSAKEVGLKDDSVYCLDLFESLAQTHRFSVCVDAFLPSEKKIFREVIETIKINTKEEKRAQDLLEKYNCKTT